MVSLTKKNFDEFAEILKENDTKKSIARDMISYFRRANPRFDTRRFKKAADLEEMI